MIPEATISSTNVKLFFLPAKLIFFIIVLFLIILAAPSTAQETWEEMAIIEEAEIYEISFVNSYTGFVAGGGSETTLPGVFKTIDGGLHWTPLDHNMEGRLTAIGFINDTTGFASTKLGLDAFIYRTTDQGDTWEKVHTMYLRTPGFSFTDESTAYAIQTLTDYAMTTKSSDCGETWEAYDTFSTEWGGAGVTDFQFLSENTGYMIYESGIMYRTDDGGETFQEVYRDFQYDFIALHFLNADTGYVVGEVKYGRDANSNSGLVLKTTNGGASWQSTPLQDECTDVVFVNADMGYIATGSGPLHTYNGGQEWHQSTTTPQGNIETMCFPSTHTGYAIGSKFYQDAVIFKNGVTFGTSIDDKQKSKVNVYPNPASHYLYFSLHPGIEVARLAIYSMRGQLLMEPEETRNAINISSLPPGSYLLEIHTAESVARKKFVVK